MWRTSATPGSWLIWRATSVSLAGLPVAVLAPPYRVFAVDAPVTYRCDLSAGTLTRHAGYGFVASQPEPPSSGSSAVLATGVTACRFAYDSSSSPGAHSMTR